MVGLLGGGWRQVGGDQDAASYGGVLARRSGEDVELREISPLWDAMGLRDTASYGDGTPFEARQAYFDGNDLRIDNPEMQEAAAHCMGGEEELSALSLEQRAEIMAEYHGFEPADYGGMRGRGWGIDVLPAHPERIHWWSADLKDPISWWDTDDEYLRDIEDVVSDKRVAELRLAAANSHLDDLRARYMPNKYHQRLRGGLTLLKQLATRNT